jgi:hypothetical protein
MGTVKEVMGAVTSFLHSMSNDISGVLVEDGVSTGNVLGVRGMREWEVWEVWDSDVEGDSGAG